MNTLLEIAKKSALDAGKLVASMLGKSEIRQKGSTNNLVTEADMASEHLIASMLREQTPGVAILGEESHKVDRLDLPKLWIIDPLDGTNNFAHGIPQFSISIAYAEYGKVLVGAVYDPMKNELFSAAHGQGAWMNDQKIHVSETRALSDAMIATGFYYDRGELMENTLKALYHLFKSNIQCIRRMGSAALDLCWVASGRFDAYYEYMLSPWDFAAGALILEEAGGKWGDRNGINNGLNSKGIICSNGHLNEMFLDIVKYTVVQGQVDKFGL